MRIFKSIKEDIINKSVELMNICEIAMVGSNGEEGFPNIKAMIKIETEGLIPI